jgi:cell wall-associated NlpC family hydrolase
MRSLDIYICALGLAVGASRSTLAHAQAATGTRDARAAHEEGKNMTELNTVALPAAAPASREAAGQEAIRPFRAHVPDADIADLRRRLAATRWSPRRWGGRRRRDCSASTPTCRRR